MATRFSYSEIKKAPMIITIAMTSRIKFFELGYFKAINMAIISKNKAKRANKRRHRLCRDKYSKSTTLIIAKNVAISASNVENYWLVRW